MQLAISQIQPVIKVKAFAWTVGTHALLLLLFFMFSYTVVPQPPPPVDPGGLEVSLGTTETGKGKGHPERKGAPAEYRAAVEFRNAPSHSRIPENIVKSNEADAPEITKTSKKTGKVEEKEKPRPHEAPKYTYNGDKGTGGNGAPENSAARSGGLGTTPGDQGNPNGSAASNNMNGEPGDGSGGIGHNLSGRTIYPDRFEAEFHESGKVVIHVTVDKNGNIVDKRVKSSSSPQLTRIALEKLGSAHFSKSSGLEPQQFGDVTITFKTRQ